MEDEFLFSTFIKTWEEEHKIKELVCDSALLEAADELRQREYMLSYEREMLDFIECGCAMARVLGLTRPQRLLIHRLAHRFGLHHVLDDDGETIHLLRTPLTAVPPALLTELLHAYEEERSSRTVPGKGKPVVLVRRSLNDKSPFDDGQFSAGKTSPSPASMKEKERQYNDARARIFGHSVPEKAKVESVPAQPLQTPPTVAPPVVKQQQPPRQSNSGRKGRGKGKQRKQNRSNKRQVAEEKKRSPQVPKKPAPKKKPQPVPQVTPTVAAPSSTSPVPPPTALIHDRAADMCDPDFDRNYDLYRPSAPMFPSAPRYGEVFRPRGSGGYSGGGPPYHRRAEREYDPDFDRSRDYGQRSLDPPFECGESYYPPPSGGYRAPEGDYYDRRGYEPRRREEASYPPLRRSNYPDPSLDA